MKSESRTEKITHVDDLNYKKKLNDELEVIIFLLLNKLKIIMF